MEWSRSARPGTPAVRVTGTLFSSDQGAFGQCFPQPVLPTEVSVEAVSVTAVSIEEQCSHGRFMHVRWHVRFLACQIHGGPTAAPSVTDFQVRPMDVQR
jgi:hypothetical protein